MNLTIDILFFRFHTQAKIKGRFFALLKPNIKWTPSWIFFLHLMTCLEQAREPHGSLFESHSSYLQLKEGAFDCDTHRGPARKSKMASGRFICL